MLTPAELHKFCSRDPFRVTLQRPFSRGAFTYATNGAIILQVPRIDEILERADAPSLDDIIKRFDCAGSLTFRPLKIDKLPALVTSSEACKGCYGSGFEHECPDCSCPCEDCNGKGAVDISSDDDFCARIGQTIFDSKYIRMIGGLLGIEIQYEPPQIDPTTFKFDGGLGLIMPMRFGKLHCVHLEEEEML